MEKLIGVVVVVVLVGGVVVWAVRREIKSARNLAALAARLCLRFRPSKENEPGVGNTAEGDFKDGLHASGRMRPARANRGPSGWRFQCVWPVIPG